MRSRLRAVLLVTALAPTLLVGHGGSATASVEHVPPETISVCRSNGSVDEVAFRYYVKTVMGSEFPESWPMETLEAGAVAVKSFAWYHVEHPYRPGRCHISDSTRHQKYAPGAAGSRTSAAVDRSWNIRMDEVRGGSRVPAYAQYCGPNCGAFTDGQVLKQYEARDQGAAGWSAHRILTHHYRGKNRLRIFDWRDGFDVRIAGERPLAAYRDEHFVLHAPVDGVPGDYRDADGHLHVDCTVAGERRSRRVQVAGIDSDGVIRFDGADGMKDCEETELRAVVRLRVRGEFVASAAAPVWKPWRTDSPRDARRVVDTDNPVKGAVAVSRHLFTDADGSPLAQDERRRARGVVIARADKFADALAATGLARADAPILLNAGGEAPLDGRVAEEIDRVLDDGQTVHIVGGPNAISRDVENDRRLESFEVVRHAGSDRIQTAVAVADAVRDQGADVGGALIARAYPDTTAGWADAVTGGAYAAAHGHPVLLTATDRLSTETERWVETNEVQEAILLGGPNAVPADAEDRLDTATTRIAGDSRDGTAVQVADRLWTRDGNPDVTGVLIIDAYEDRGWQFALVGAVWAANHGTPQLVSHHLVPRYTTGAWLDAHADVPVDVIGGDRIVADHVLDAVSRP